MQSGGLFSSLSGRSPGTFRTAAALNGRAGRQTDLCLRCSIVKFRGDGEWQARKHGASRHRRWCKVYIGLDAPNRRRQGHRIHVAAAQTARAMGCEEEVLAGTSAGAIVNAATILARRPEFAGKTIVAILPDSAERYLGAAAFAAG